MRKRPVILTAVEANYAEMFAEKATTDAAEQVAEALSTPEEAVADRISRMASDAMSGFINQPITELNKKAIAKKVQEILDAQVTFAVGLKLRVSGIEDDGLGTINVKLAVAK